MTTDIETSANRAFGAEQALHELRERLEAEDRRKVQFMRWEEPAVVLDQLIMDVRDEQYAEKLWGKEFTL